MPKIQKIYVGNKLVYPVWKPTTNTVAYYPLTASSTVNDLSGNSRTLTNNGTSFGTYGGVSCAYFPQGNSKKLYGTLPLSGNAIFTFNVYIQRIGNSYVGGDGGSQIFVLGSIGSSGGCFGTAIKSSTAQSIYSPNHYLNYTWGSDKLSTTANTTGQWKLITVTNDKSTIKMYENGVLINSNSISFNVNTNFTIGSRPTSYGTSGDYQNFYGYMSEFIVESKARTAQEIQNYYNQTKSKYGL